MNMVKAIAPQVDIQQAVQAKTKTKNGADFLEILSGAIKAAGVKPEDAVQAAGETKPSGQERILQDESETDVNPAKPDTQDDDAEPDGVAIANMAVQMQPQAQADVLPDIQPADDEAAVQSVNHAVQAVPVNTQAQPETKARPQTTAQPEAKAQPETSVRTETKAQPETSVQPETKAQPETSVKSETSAKPGTKLQSREQVQQETETRPEPEINVQAVQAKAGQQNQQLHTQTEDPVRQVQAVDSGPTAQRTDQPAREQAVPQAQAEVQAQASRPVTRERNAETAKADSGIVSAETVITQPESLRSQTVRRDAAVQRHTGADKAQTKFDGMLDRASRELGQVRTVVQEQPVAEEEPAQTVNEPQIPEIPEMTATPETLETNETPEISEQDTAEPEQAVQEEDAAVIRPVETEREAKPAEPKHESWRTETVRTYAPEILSARPAKTVRKAEEAVAEAIQPKAPHMPEHQAIRTETHTPANPASNASQFEQVRAQVVRNLEDQRMEFNMQLHPEELGKVNIKMILEGGKLAIEIIAANSRATEIMHKQAESLISSLRLGNLEVSSVNIVTAGQNASGSMDGEYNLSNFRGQAGQQGGQSQNHAADGRGESRSETPAKQPDETAETRPKGILNYLI